MTPGWWHERRVLVTGAAGFIGSALCRELAGRVAHLRGIDNLERGRLEHLSGVLPRLEFQRADLSDREVARRACDGMDVVLHFAAKVGGIGLYLEQPYQTAAANARIDTNVCDSVARTGGTIMIYASSAHVYPDERQTSPDSPPLAEPDAYPANPTLSYGWEKLFGERLLEALVHEGRRSGRAIHAAPLRLVGAFGPGQDDDLRTGSAIPVFIRRALDYPKNGPFIVRGTGRETRSYCYIDDIVAAVLRAAEALDQRDWLPPMNVGAEGRVSMDEVARLVVAAVGKPIPIEFDPSFPTVIWGQAVTCQLARELLGNWRPQVALEEGIRRCCAAALARQGGAA